MTALVSRSLLAISVAVFFWTHVVFAQTPFDVSGPGMVSGDFRITTFATGLNFPMGMVELDDGSVLVAVSNGSGSFFSSSSGSLVRYVDSDDDGVSDSSSTLVSDVAGGALTCLRRAGNLFFVTGVGSGRPISNYLAGATPADALTLQGTITLTYPGSWWHSHTALGVRDTPGQPNNYDLFFQLGSEVNHADTVATVTLSSTIGVSGTLAGDAIHKVRITDNGASVSGSDLEQIAT